MRDELTGLLEIFHKVEETGGKATLSITTSMGLTKTKLEIVSPTPGSTASTSVSSPPAPGNQAAGRRRHRNHWWVVVRWLLLSSHCFNLRHAAKSKHMFLYQFRILVELVLNVSIPKIKRPIKYCSIMVFSWPWEPSLVSQTWPKAFERVLGGAQEGVGRGTTKACKTYCHQGTNLICLQQAQHIRWDNYKANI